MTESPWKPGGARTPHPPRSVLALAILIKVVGVAGFVGLLVAAQHLRGAEYPCRMAALLWFAVFGIAYVLISLKAPNGGRRWL